MVYLLASSFAPIDLASLITIISPSLAPTCVLPESARRKVGLPSDAGGFRKIPRNGTYHALGELRWKQCRL